MILAYPPPAASLAARSNRLKKKSLQSLLVTEMENFRSIGLSCPIQFSGQATAKFIGPKTGEPDVPRLHDIHSKFHFKYSNIYFILKHIYFNLFIAIFTLL